IALQSKGLNVDETATKIEALRFYVKEKRNHSLDDAIDIATKKSEDFDIPKEKRLWRKHGWLVRWPAMQDSHRKRNFQKICWNVLTDLELNFKQDRSLFQM
ncbi:hypothetical protein J6590_105567, partial [Homalodisca vitripennis]